MKKLLLSLAILLQLTSLSAQTPFTPQYGTYELTVDAPEETFILPLKQEEYAKMTFGTTKMPKFVRLKNNNNKRFEDAVSFKQDPHESRLLVTVKTDQLSAQGTYEVGISFVSDNKPGELDFYIVRPATVLEASGPVVLTFTKWCGEEHDQLMLRETGGRAGIAALKLPSPVVHNVSKGKLIEFKGAYTVPKGGTLQTDYQINEKFADQLKYGKNTAKITLTSPELSAPVTIDFEIWKKMPQWIMFIWIVLGLAVGFILRHYIPEQQDLETARLKAFQLIARITADIKSIQDEAFRTQARTFADQIDDLTRQRKKGSEISADTDKILPQYEDLIKDLKERLATEQARYKVFGNIAETKNTEDAVMSSITAILSPLPEAKNALDNRDPGTAKELLDEMAKELTDEIKRFADYAGKAAAEFLKPENLPKELSQVTVDQVSAAARDIQTEAGSLSAEPQDSAVVKMNAIQKSMKEIVLILKKAIVPEDEPQDDQNAFLKAVRLWLQTLADMVENKDHATLPETHLDDRLKQRVDSAWGMGGLMNEDEERENVILNWLTGTVRSLKISSKFDNIDQVLKQADQSTATASRRINAYEVVRFILLAITFSVGIYYSYGPKFVGEFMEMLGIFLFTVSLDMTVDNIQQLKPKSA